MQELLVARIDNCTIPHCFKLVAFERRESFGVVYLEILAVARQLDGLIGIDIIIATLAARNKFLLVQVEGI